MNDLCRQLFAQPVLTCLSMFAHGALAGFQELGISSAAMTIMESFIQARLACGSSAYPVEAPAVPDHDALRPALRRTCLSASPLKRRG